MQTKKIVGLVIYKNVGMGAWGIQTEDGKIYRPVNMPEQLKDENARITVWAREISEDASMHMWGIPVEISSFSTTLK